MLSDPWSPSKNALSTCRRYLSEIVTQEIAAGNRKTYFIEFPMQDGSRGFGADWHPNLATHQVMADTLIRALRTELHW